MGGSTKQTTITNDPPAWLKELFDKLAKDSKTLYDDGKGGNVYPGKTSVPVGQDFNAATDAMRDDAKAYKDKTRNNPYFNNDTSSSQFLNDLASGKYLREGNPFFKDRLNSAIADSNDLIQQQFAGAGRYGSAADTNALARNTNKLTLDALSSQFNQDVKNMLTANQFIDQSNNAKTDALNKWLRGRDLADKNWLDAASDLDKRNQQGLDADKKMWEENDNKEWNRLKMLLDFVKGAAGSYGTKSSNESGGSFDFFKALKSFF